MASVHLVNSTPILRDQTRPWRERRLLGALNFVGGSTQNMSLGTGNGLDFTTEDLTIACWFSVTGTMPSSALRGFYGKGPSSAGLWFNSSGGGAAPVFQRNTNSTTNLVAASWTSWRGITGNRWFFIAAQLRFGGAAGEQRIFMGTDVDVPHEPSAYTNQQGGAGTVDSTAGLTAYVGSLTGGATESWPGRIAWIGIWANYLTNAQIYGLWQQETIFGDCRLFMYPGQGGGVEHLQHDYSGYQNHGTVTGAVPGVPLARPWPSRRRAYAYIDAAPVVTTWPGYVSPYGWH